MQSLHPLTRQELERRGPSNVRALINEPQWVGVGQNAEIKLHAPGVPNPERAQVEEWLRGKERTANRNNILVAVLTLIFAAVGAIGSVIAAWPVLQEWMK